MEYFFNIASIISCGLCFVLMAITSPTSAVPLTRIISDTLQGRENRPGVHPSHPENFGPLTLNAPRREIDEPSPKFPPAGKVHNNGEAADNQGGRLPLARSLKGSALFRIRRQTGGSSQCVVSPHLPVLEASDLNTLLNATTFLGLNPSQPNIPSIPSNQPNQCPSVYNPWWPGVEENLRSTCPWRWDRVDLSEKFGTTDVYPRYVRQATCLCQTCVTANIMGCSQLRQPITVFQKVGCKNGLAVMLKKTIDVTVGCYCQNPAPNNQQSTSSSGLPPVND